MECKFHGQGAPLFNLAETGSSWKLEQELKLEDSSPGLLPADSPTDIIIIHQSSSINLSPSPLVALLSSPTPALSANAGQPIATQTHHGEPSAVDAEVDGFRAPSCPPSPRPPHHIRLHHATLVEGAAGACSGRSTGPAERARDHDRACFRVCHGRPRRPCGPGACLVRDKT